MKILMVDRAGAQSIWSLMEQIARTARAAGHDVQTCRWDDGAAQEDHSDGLRIPVPPRRRPWDVARQHVAFAGPFRRLLADTRPDILVTNFIVPGGLAALLARAAGIPVLCVHHELFSSLAPHLQLWSRLTGPVCTRHIFVSHTVAASYGRPGRVILNGLDRAALAQVTPLAETPAPMVIAGRFDPAKGIDIAIKALARARTQDPSLRLDIIGDGALRGAYETLAGEGCRFLGWRPRTEVLRRMKGARAVLIPSRHEGFGLTLAEALALGRPTIASDLPALREVAAQGQGTRFIAPGDPNALAHAMLHPPPSGELDPDALDQTHMAAAYLGEIKACLTKY